jgi:hypothetical protein
MMFGHLKAEDFINMFDGVALSERKQQHFASCAQCRQTFDATNQVRAKVALMANESEEHLPEPDWSGFRASVRDRLLSRSIQRESTQHRWSVWPWKPAMVWSMSVMFALGLTTGLFVWSRTAGNGEHLTPVGVITEAEIDADSLPEIEAWIERDAFEELARLGSDEAAVLGTLLQGTTEPSETQ